MAGVRRGKNRKRKLVREDYGGEIYEYYPLGHYVVMAPGVCGGRPTFKYTRIEVAGILDMLAAGWTAERIVKSYKRPELPREAIEEAVQLAAQAFVNCYVSPKTRRTRLKPLYP
jgi:uncharacterized protein (DUF433 family)